jgi:uncharacterized membrane protein YhhN
MKLQLALLTIFFWIILGTDCILIINNLDTYRVYTKPLLMPVLYIIMALQTADTSHQRSKVLISFVLLFALVGDVLLLNNAGRLYFIGGLSAFLIAHIFYIILFFKIKRLSAKRTGVLVLAAIIIIALLTLLLNSMWDKIAEENYTIPVLAYATTIGLMLLMAVNTATGKRARKTAWKNFLPGALLFVVSDSLLAISKFYAFINPPPELYVVLSCAIMISYGSAQLLLITGFTKFIKN